MNLWQRFKKTFIPRTKRNVQALPFDEGAASAGVDHDEIQYRRLSQSRRDYSPLLFEKTLKLSISLYSKNPFFARLVLMPVQAIIASGITIIADDPKVQMLIDVFWGDNKSGLKKIIRNFFVDMMLTGELHLPFSINKVNGLMSLSALDTLAVKDIKRDPNNPLRHLAVEYYTSDTLGSTNTAKAEIVNKGGMNFFEVPAGDIFSFFYNPQSAVSKRGTPSAMALIDWIDLLDQALFNDVERWSSLRAFVWEVILEGKDEHECEAWLQENFPEGVGPKPNSVWAHNEGLKINALNPDLKATDSRAMFDMLRTMIIGSAGYPLWFFGYGGDTNVATAREQNAPTVWNIEDVQTAFQNVIETLVWYQIYAAQKIGYYTSLGKITESTPAGFKVQMGAVLQRDHSRFFAVLNAAITAAREGMAANLLSREVALQTICYALNQHDFNITPDELGRQIDLDLIAEETRTGANGNANGKSNGKITMPLKDLLISDFDN